MKQTVQCDGRMVIRIPLASLKEAKGCALMPDQLYCVYIDAYKVFLSKGRPRQLGATQAMVSLFLFGLRMTLSLEPAYIVTPVVFMITGVMSFAAGLTPNMCLAKLSLSLNIMSLFCSMLGLIATFIPIFGHFTWLKPPTEKVVEGILGLSAALMALELFLALFLTYQMSAALCKQQFTTLPAIQLTLGELNLNACDEAMEQNDGAQ